MKYSNRSNKQTVNANYRYKKIIYVDELPKTSVGKVKRYKLSTLVDKETNSGSIGSVLEDNVNNIESIENWLCQNIPIAILQKIKK